MDTKIERYRQALIKIMDGYANTPSLNPLPDDETVFVCDEKNDHYILHRIGWQETKRIWNTPLYVRIRNGKFYVEIDWTEDGIANELISVGLSKDDIVLAFQHPSVRPMTDFAIA